MVSRQNLMDLSRITATVSMLLVIAGTLDVFTEIANHGL